MGLCRTAGLTDNTDRCPNCDFAVWTPVFLFMELWALLLTVLPVLIRVPGQGGIVITGIAGDFLAQPGWFVERLVR